MNVLINKLNGGSGKWGIPSDALGVYYKKPDAETQRIVYEVGSVYSEELPSEVWNFTGHTATVHCIAIDKDGFIYSGSSDKTVRKITSGGVQIWSFAGHTSEIFNIVVDQDGYIYSGDGVHYTGGNIKKISQNGEEIWNYTLPNTSSTSGIAVDSNGYIFATTSFGYGKTLSKISPNGEEICTREDPYVEAVCIDDLDDVYITVNRVGSIGPGDLGTGLYKLSNDLTTCILGVATGYPGELSLKNNYCYMQESNDNTLLKIDKNNGSIVWKFYYQYRFKILGMAGADDDSIYFGGCSTDIFELVKINKNHELLWNLNVKPDYPRSVAIDNEFIYLGMNNSMVNKMELSFVEKLKYALYE